MERGGATERPVAHRHSVVGYGNASVRCGNGHVEVADIELEPAVGELGEYVSEALSSACLRP